MKKNIPKIAGTIFVMLVTILTACVPRTQLLTTGAQPADVTGTYTLLLYGCHYADDVKNVAILIDEGNKSPFEIYDINTSYTVKKGVPAKQALSEADSFVRCSSHRVLQTELRRIPDANSNILGYEMRPLYFPLDFGKTDIFLISYSLKDGTIRAYIRLLPDVEKKIKGPDRGGSSGR